MQKSERQVARRRVARRWDARDGNAGISPEEAAEEEEKERERRRRRRRRRRTAGWRKVDEHENERGCWRRGMSGGGWGARRGPGGEGGGGQPRSGRVRWSKGWKCKKAPGASLNTEAAAQAPSFCFSYVAASLSFFQDGRPMLSRAHDVGNWSPRGGSVPPRCTLYFAGRRRNHSGENAAVARRYARCTTPFRIPPRETSILEEGRLRDWNKKSRWFFYFWFFESQFSVGDNIQVFFVSKYDECVLKWMTIERRKFSN